MSFSQLGLRSNVRNLTSGQLSRWIGSCAGNRKLLLFHVSNWLCTAGGSSNSSRPDSLHKMRTVATMQHICPEALPASGHSMSGGRPVSGRPTGLESPPPPTHTHIHTRPRSVRLISPSPEPAAAAAAAEAALPGCPEWARVLCHSLWQLGNSARELTDLFRCAGY